jgi:hypothetical protein
MFNKRLIAALVLGGLMFLMVAGGSALAAKGGGHHGGGGTPPPTGSYTCSVAPNPVAAGQQVTITGSAFPANISVTITVAGSGGTAMLFATIDATGHLSATYWAGWSGTNTVSVQSGAATCSFQVV